MNIRNFVIGMAFNFFICAGLNATQIKGSGATFPEPLYLKWAEAYEKMTGIHLDYQAIGSAGGIQQIESQVVDFGASDKPLQADELKKHNLVQFPAVMGGIVIIVNLREAETQPIHLTPSILARIFLGDIKNWSDPEIQKINPDIKLPAKDILVVHRSDGSGTTFLFTNYLSKVSPNWKRRVGEGTEVLWFVGVGEKGNEGVARYVKSAEGTIGYVEFGYAKQNNLKVTSLENKDGQKVLPSLETFKAAAENANWQGAQDYLILTNQPGKNTWPITGASFILMQQSPASAETTQAVQGFFNWCFENGQMIAQDLDYVPLPSTLVKLIQETWKTAFGVK